MFLNLCDIQHFPTVSVGYCQKLFCESAPKYEACMLTFQNVIWALVNYNIRSLEKVHAQLENTTYSLSFI